MWEEFWGDWVPEATHKEPYAVAINGDLIDGRHHNSTTQWSQNLADQCRHAQMIVEGIKRQRRFDGHLYIIRGTEAHCGPEGNDEERMAADIKAIPDKAGMHSRYELWIKVGQGLVHCAHHIGITGRSHYESSAVMAELAEAYAEAGRWRNRPPDVVVRSHRHRQIEIRVPTSLGYGISFTTPGWQLKTPFVYRIPGGRQAQPQFGGSLIRQGDQDLFTRHKVWSIQRDEEET
jgi:hypothetical protein